MIVEDCTADHLKRLANFGGQESLRKFIEQDDPVARLSVGPSKAGIVDGQVIICAGVIHVHDYRAIAWAIVPKSKPMWFPSIHKAVRDFFNAQPYKRIEAEIDPDVPEAARWAKLLGFELERKHMPFYFPDGSDADLYVLLR